MVILLQFLLFALCASFFFFFFFVTVRISLFFSGVFDASCLVAAIFLATYSAYCILVDSSTVICWTSPFVILEVLDLFCRFYSIFMENSINFVDSDQTPHNVASDLGPHCLPMTLLRVSTQERVNSFMYY